jgi:hypothetical protein
MDAMSDASARSEDPSAVHGTTVDPAELQDLGYEEARDELITVVGRL